MNLSEKIIGLRKREGYSQEDLAQKLDVTRQSVSKWETGESQPEISKLRNIAQLFNVSTDWLLSEEGFETLNRLIFKSTPSQTNMSFIERTAKRYGWLFGAYVLGVGIFMVIIALIFKSMTNNMTGTFNDWTSDYMVEFNQFKPMDLSIFPMILGMILIVVGIVLIILLRKYIEDTNDN